MLTLFRQRGERERIQDISIAASDRRGPQGSRGIEQFWQQKNSSNAATHIGAIGENRGLGLALRRWPSWTHADKMHGAVNPHYHKHNNHDFTFTLMIIQTTASIAEEQNNLQYFFQTHINEDRHQTVVQIRLHSVMRDSGATFYTALLSNDNWLSSQIITFKPPAAPFRRWEDQNHQKKNSP